MVRAKSELVNAPATAVPPMPANRKRNAPNSPTTSMPTKRIFRGTQIVTLKVGPDEVPFPVHKELLCEVSPVFAAAFSSKSGFKESEEMTMKFLEDDPDTFEMLVQWVYTKRYETPKPSDFHDKGQYLMRSMRLFLLADMLNVPDLKDRLFHIFFHVGMNSYAYGYPSKRIIELAYANTVENAPIRKIAVDWLVWVSEGYLEEPDNKAWLLKNPEIAVELCIALDKIKADPYDDGPFQTLTAGEYLDQIGAVKR